MVGSIVRLTSGITPIDQFGQLVLFLLIPDQVQPRVFNEQFAPQLRDTVAIVVASGYNVFYRLLHFTSKQDVVMVAPRYACLYCSL